MEELINQKVKSGLYYSASEVVREGLRLLKEQDDIKKRRYEEMKEEVLKGVRQLENGQYKTFSSAEELGEYIKKEGRKRLEDKKKKTKDE